jgi:hypothetical protein
MFSRIWGLIADTLLITLLIIHRSFFWWMIPNKYINVISIRYYLISIYILKKIIVSEYLCQITDQIKFESLIGI